MNIKLGDTITSLRKAKGLTQEQLANAVGVSTPAVSKWETDSSYPDITLLGPIARTLGTNIDTLMNFAPKLTDAQATAFAVEVATIARKEGNTTALQRMHEILHTYPENPMLQFQMAAILTGLPTTDHEAKESSRQQAKEMLDSVIADGNARLFPGAVNLLASLCIEDNELERAEALIQIMPAPTPDAELLKAALYEKRGDINKARLTVQTSLYLAFQKVETCLSKLITRNYVTETEKALQICEIHQQIALMMDYPYAMSERLFAEVYLRAGNREAAAENLFQLAQTLNEGKKAWKSALFSEMKMSTEQTNNNLKLLRKVVYDGIKDDPLFEQLRENEKYQEAIKLLQS